VSGDRCRLDVWLWRARFFKTRSLAASAVEAGGVYLERNGQSRVAGKPATAVLPGDGLSLRKGGAVRTLRVLALGVRRGPPAEARALYEALDASELDETDAADHSLGAQGGHNREPDPQ
jgi:ribosome-associated heat shock protein Hsp15